MPVPRVTLSYSRRMFMFSNFWTLEICMSQVTYMRSWFSLNNYCLLFRYLPLVRLISGCRDMFVSPPVLCIDAEHTYYIPRTKELLGDQVNLSLSILIIRDAFEKFLAIALDILYLRKE